MVFQNGKYYLNDRKIGEITVDAVAPLILGNTSENLKTAVAGEHLENATLYPEFVGIAEKEGCSVRIGTILSVEVHHEARYRKLLKNVEQGSVFKKR